MPRLILYPAGEVRDLPADTPCTYMPHAMDGAVGIGVEIRRYGKGGKLGLGPEDDALAESVIIAYPTTRLAREQADERAREEDGPDARGCLDVIDNWGNSHLMNVPLSARSLGDLCLVHLGERDGLGRRLWQLGQVEIPRELLDEAERLLVAPEIRQGYERGLREGGTFGYALRLAIVQAERLGLDAAPLEALRARAHAIVGHNHGA